MGIVACAAAAHAAIAAPLEGQTTITIDGQAMTLTHWAHSVRSADFRVRAQIADGSFVEFATAPPRTIRGIIKELPGSIVAGSILDDGLHVLVHLPDGGATWVEPQGERVMFANAAPHVEIIAPVHDTITRAHPKSQAESLLECAIAQIAYDADYHAYLSYNSSVQDVVDRIETILNAVNVQYENEVGIIHEITEIVVRTSLEQNPYTSNNAGVLLQQFRAVWNSPTESEIERDLAHLFTGRVLEGGIVGIAYLASVCDDLNAYGVVRDLNIEFDCVTAFASRILAIKWGATHCDCPGTTMHTMPGCNNTFIGPGSNSVDEILAYKDSVDCLEPCAPGCAFADFNCDGVVGVADLLYLLENWGGCNACPAAPCPADLTGSCSVGVTDLLVLLANWG